MYVTVTDNASDGEVERCVLIQGGKKDLMNHPTCQSYKLRITVNLATTRINFYRFKF